MLTTLSRPEAGSRLSAPRVDIVGDYDAFVALEREWNAAVERSQVPHPFLRHEWIRAWWDSFQGNKQLHIIVVRDQGRIIGLAPLMREHALMYGLPIRKLALLANDHSPRADFVIAGASEEAYDAICRTLKAESDDWDVLQLTQLPRNGRTAAVMSRFAADEELPIGTWGSSDSPYLELAGTWDSYWASLPAKFRSNVRNRFSRLRQLGEPSLEMLTERPAVADALRDAWRLEASGWKDQEGTSILSDPAVQKFYTLLAERGTEAGWMRLLFLTVAGKRIAVSYSALYEGRLFLIKTGHDRDFHTCSPFKLLTYLAAQEGFARGLREIDFLGDSEPWKQEWTTAARGHDWLFIFSRSRRARLLHSLKFQMAPEIKKKWRA